MRARVALDLGDTPVIYLRNPPPVKNAYAFDELAETLPTDAVAASIARITPDTVAKFLFTSGSTGMPKAVINTQRMLCANQAMLARSRAFEDRGQEEAMLEWMPWNHTMAGNGTALRGGLLAWAARLGRVDKGFIYRRAAASLRKRSKNRMDLSQQVADQGAN